MGAKVATFEQCYNAEKRRRLPYYDHALTKIEKNNLLRSIDEIKRPFASKETTDDESQAFDFLSECKDKRLISILQI